MDKNCQRRREHLFAQWQVCAHCSYPLLNLYDDGDDNDNDNDDAEMIFVKKDMRPQIWALKIYAKKA